MQIKEFMKAYPELTDAQIDKFISEHQNEDLPAEALGKIFESKFIGADNRSAEIQISELAKIHHSFNITNGGGFSRRDRGYLGTKYYVVNHKVKRHICSVEVIGRKTVPSPKQYKKVKLETISELKKALDRTEKPDDTLKALINQISEI